MFKIGDRVKRHPIEQGWINYLESYGLDPLQSFVVSEVIDEHTIILAEINDGAWSGRYFRQACYQSQQEINDAVLKLINS